MKLYAPFIKEATLRVTMTLRSEGHGGDPSPKLQGFLGELEDQLILLVQYRPIDTTLYDNPQSQWKHQAPAEVS